MSLHAASVKHWGYAVKSEKRFLCTIDEEDGELVTLRVAPLDFCVLLELADEMDMDAGCHAYVDDYDMYEYARRIREALGVVCDD